MFRLEEHTILYLLIFIPIGLVLVWLTLKWKKNVFNGFGDQEVFSRLYPGWSTTREWIKGGLLLTVLALLLVSWANPQWGTRTEKIKAKSSDIFIALDISQSMLAEDISPNRMERAKRFTIELLGKLRGERIGLIYFAGSAYMQMPLTHDFANAEVHIRAANPSQAGTQGTIIAEAINLARESFTEESPTQKALIIISDGEDHEVDAVIAAEQALAEGIHIYTVGIGSEAGGRVPASQGSKTYKTDTEGNIIISTLNKEMLTELATTGGGHFYLLDQVMSALGKIDSEIEKLEKKETEQRSFTEFNSYFQVFLFPAILLLFFEFLFSSMKNSNKNWKSLFGIKQ